MFVNKYRDNEYNRGQQIYEPRSTSSRLHGSVGWSDSTTTFWLFPNPNYSISFHCTIRTSAVYPSHGRVMLVVDETSIDRHYSHRTNPRRTAAHHISSSHRFTLTSQSLPPSVLPQSMQCNYHTTGMQTQKLGDGELHSLAKPEHFVRRRLIDRTTCPPPQEYTAARAIPLTASSRVTRSIDLAVSSRPHEMPSRVPYVHCYSTSTHL